MESMIGRVDFSESRSLSLWMSDFPGLNALVRPDISLVSASQRRVSGSIECCFGRQLIPRVPRDTAWKPRQPSHARPDTCYSRLVPSMAL
jgi:hypothetical protein